MFSQIVPVVKTIPGKFEESALPVLTLRIGLPCTGRYARLSSDPIISFYKIQKVNSLLGHTSYGRIHNVQPALTVRGGNSSSRPCCASVCTVARDRMEMPMPSAMHRLSAAASSMTAMIQFIKRQIVILEEIQCFLLGARVVLAQQERFVQERCQRVRLALIGTEMRCVR